MKIYQNPKQEQWFELINRPTESISDLQNVKKSKTKIIFLTGLSVYCAVEFCLYITIISI